MSEQSVQLTLEIPGWPPLEVEPTAAMRRGDQSLFQCAWCGCVVVVPHPPGQQLGPCPSCADPRATWWGQEGLPLAGLRERAG